MRQLSIGYVAFLLPNLIDSLWDAAFATAVRLGFRDDIFRIRQQICNTRRH